MGWVPEGEEQADRNRLRIELRQRSQVERFQDAFGPDPLAHAYAALERNEGRRMVGTQPVQVRPVLSPKVEQVLEARGRHKRCSRPLALEKRVGRDRRPVREALDRPGTDGAGGCDDRLLRASGSRKLRRAELAGFEKDRVRERAADVDPEDGHRPTLGDRVAARNPRASFQRIPRPTR